MMTDNTLILSRYDYVELESRVSATTHLLSLANDLGENWHTSIHCLLKTCVEFIGNAQSYISERKLEDHTQLKIESELLRSALEIVKEKGAKGREWMTPLFDLMVEVTERLDKYRVVDEAFVPLPAGGPKKVVSLDL